MNNLKDFTPEQQVAFVTNRHASALENVINSNNGYSSFALAMQNHYVLSPEAWELLLNYYENLEHINKFMSFCEECYQEVE